MQSFESCLRLLLVTTLLLAFRLPLIRAAVSNSSEEEDYDDEGITTTIIHNPTDHFANCTFNGKIYYDEECSEWMRNFYISLSVSMIGMILFLLAFIYCSKRCCSRTNGDFDRLIENQEIVHR